MSFIGNVLGAAIGADSSRKAANTQADAARYASDTTERMYDKGVALNEPWRQTGLGALSDLAAGSKTGGDFMRDFTMADFQADPGYAFRVAQGQKGLEASAAARGGLLSGGTGKDLVNYGQEAGSQEFSNAYNRFNADRDRRFNRLSSLAGTGQTATRDVTQQGAAAAGQMGEYATQGANASAAGSIARGNSINNAIGTIGNWWQQQPSTSGGNVGGFGTSGLNNFFYGQGTSGD